MHPTRPVAAVMLAALLAAFATTALANNVETLESDEVNAAVEGGVGGAVRDPWEGFNRPVFAFNDALDRYTLRPLARAYEANVPEPVRDGVSNVLRNLGEPFSALNHLLQGRPGGAVTTTMRFTVNSVFGVLGVFDVAGRAGLPRQPRDFGQTLAVWGAPSGPYLVLPLFGSTTVRDGTARVATAEVLQIGTIGNVPVRNTLLAADVVASRADLLPLDKVVADVALDRYAFIRDAWLQRRASVIQEIRQPAREDAAVPVQ